MKVKLKPKEKEESGFIKFRISLDKKDKFKRAVGDMSAYLKEAIDKAIDEYNSKY